MLLVVGKSFVCHNEVIWRDDGLFLQAAEKAAQQGEVDGTDGEVMFDVETVKEREEDGVGVPNITVDCSDKSVTAYDKVLQTNKLPSMEEVMALSQKKNKAHEGEDQIS